MTFAIPIGQVADIPCGYAVERKDGLTGWKSCNPRSWSSV